MTIRKKLIEVSIPLEAINKASAREKSIRHGHPSTLHLWWARRPLAACRAVLFSQLVDDPSSWPDRFPTEEDQDRERKRLHKIIEDMVPWEASNNETILNAARWEIARSVAWGLGEEPPPRQNTKAILDFLQTKAPPVYDPFSGGGSIPLEAQRLGLRAYGSDLNPVAVLIGKALVEIPPKFAGRPPVNPKAQEELKRGGEWRGKGAQGLAEDVRYYGQWMRDEAEKRIGHLYPKAKLADGSEATVIAWLWARTVRSPDPSAKGAMVPLVSSFMLSTKVGKKAWVEVVIDAGAPDGWRFEVKTGALSKKDEERLKTGTKTGRGTNFVCALTGSTISPDFVRGEGNGQRLNQRLMAIVADGGRSRVYLSPIAKHEAIAKSAEPGDTSALEVEMPQNPRWFSPPGYGMSRYVDLFTKRQLVALTGFSDLVSEARELALADAHAAGLGRETLALHEGGNTAAAYADAIATYLGLAVSKISDAQSSLCRWKPTMDQTIATFGRHAIPMVWDFAESNTFSGMAGDYMVSLRNMMRVLTELGNSGFGSVTNVNAPKNSFPVRPVAISSDPPYYDNIGYADLSDYFYVWQRRTLGPIWPNLYRRISTPKAEELVATPYRHGGREQAEAFFMEGMSNALTAMRNAATDSEPMAIYYAYKQSEIGDDGKTSAGWTSFLQAIVDAQLVIDGTWPIRTELVNRMIGRDANALASSIVLVCRKRAGHAATITYENFIRLLKRELPTAIDDIRNAGVGPVDMQQSIIGPGMGIFSRHARVLEDDDSTMSVKKAHAIINRVWGEIENEGDATLDAETQVALAWFGSYGFDTKPSGELITLANAKNIPTSALFKSEVFDDFSGKAGLKPRAKLSPDWTPADDATLTIWECVQHTARALGAEDGGDAAAARLIGQMGPKAAEAAKLTHRLYQIANDKGWAAEALVYNELAAEWPRLEALAEQLASAVAEKPADKPQYDLL